MRGCVLIVVVDVYEREREREREREMMEESRCNLHCMIQCMKVHDCIYGGDFLVCVDVAEQ